MVKIETMHEPLIFEEICTPNIRWTGPGELEQLWLIIEYRHEHIWDRRQEWREVPHAP